MEFGSSTGHHRFVFCGREVAIKLLSVILGHKHTSLFIYLFLCFMVPVDRVYPLLLYPNFWFTCSHKFLTLLKNRGRSESSDSEGSISSTWYSKHTSHCTSLMKTNLLVPLMQTGGILKWLLFFFLTSPLLQGCMKHSIGNLWDS